MDAGGRRTQTGCGQGRSRGQLWASQNRDVMPGAWLTGADGWVGGKALLPQSNMTACSIEFNKFHNNTINSVSNNNNNNDNHICRAV